MRRKFIAALMSLSLLIPAGCHQTKEEEPIKNITLPSKIENPIVDGIKKLDISEKAQIIKMENKESYYITTLAPEEANIARKIQEAITNSVERYQITYPLKPEKLRHIMRILLLDEGKNYYVSKEYYYALNNDGNVSEIQFSYNILPGLKAEYDEAIKGYFSKNITNKENTEYDIALKISELLSSHDFSQPDESFKERGFSGNIRNTLLPVVLKAKTGINSEGIAKAFATLCRNNGVSAITVYGESTMTDFTKFGMQPFQFSNITEEDVEAGGVHIVRLNTDGMYVWNMVKINDTWVHVDITYNHFFNKFLNADTNTKSWMYANTLFVSDRIASMSKIYYYNTGILGVQPFANSNNFSVAFKNGAFLPKTGITAQENKLVTLVTEKLKDKPTRFSLAFEDIENYQFAIQKMSDILTKTNDNLTGFKLTKYSLVDMPGCLTIIIDKLEYQ